MSSSEIKHDVLAAIGNTPLIRLKGPSEATGCNILAKAEFMNPGQSVKDRAALFIIQDAVQRGTLRPGGTVVEGTAGNTASASPWLATRWAIAASSSSRRRRARRRRTR